MSKKQSPRTLRNIHEDFPALREARNRFDELTAERTGLQQRIDSLRAAAGDSGADTDVAAEAATMLSGGGAAVAVSNLAELQEGTHQLRVLGAAVGQQEKIIADQRRAAESEIAAEWRAAHVQHAKTIDRLLRQLQDAFGAERSFLKQATAAGCPRGGFAELGLPPLCADLHGGHPVIDRWRQNLHRFGYQL